MFVILNTMNDEEYVFAKNLIFGELEYSYIPSSYCFPTVFKNKKSYYWSIASPIKWFFAIFAESEHFRVYVAS